MDSWDPIFKRIREQDAHASIELVIKAVQWILRLNAEQKSKPASILMVAYDPKVVVEYLLELRLDVASIVAAIVFDHATAQGQEASWLQVEFGSDVRQIVEGTRRLLQVNKPTRFEDQAEDFRRLLLVMAKDLRVILLRLVIVLQQMRVLATTMEGTNPQVAREVMEIYAPLAHRLGMHWIKSELEDYAFRLENPAEYHKLHELIRVRRRGGKDVVAKVVKNIEQLLAQHGIKGEISGREKHLFSVYGKLLRKSVTLDDLYDLIAYRIIVPDLGDCYMVLGLIHNEWTPVPGRFKDYIALPKSNGYQSLHTVVIGPFGNRIEIQIRSEKMHRVAEDGVAAHWAYKEDSEEGRKNNASRSGYAWLKQLLTMYRDAENPTQFLESIKVDLFPDEIYLFTPHGDIVTLPRGASPVDFAYAVHSKVGDNCQGARVNGRIVPLRTVLNAGDQVAILTAKNRNPNPQWLDFVVTSKARYHITRWMKMQRREQMIDLGKELLERELRRLDPPVALNDKLIQKGVVALGLESSDELLFQIGGARVAVGHVVTLVTADGTRKEASKSELEEGIYRKKGAQADKQGLRLSGLLPDMVVQIGRCCNPLPGDAVVGIITTGKGITIHVVGCPNLAVFAQSPERWIEEIDLGEAPGKVYTARLRVMVRNQKGILVQVSQAVTEAGAGITQAKIQDRDREPCIVFVDVEVTNREHLEKVMHSIQSKVVVFGVDRVKG